MKDSFEVFADLYPHEAYRLDANQFWQIFHARNPDITREKMIEMLGETTDAPKAQGGEG